MIWAKTRNYFISLFCLLWIFLATESRAIAHILVIGQYLETANVLSPVNTSLSWYVIFFYWLSSKMIIAEFRQELTKCLWRVRPLQSMTTDSTHEGLKPSINASGLVFNHTNSIIRVGHTVRNGAHVHLRGKRREDTVRILTLAWMQ